MDTRTHTPLDIYVSHAARKGRKRFLTQGTDHLKEQFRKLRTQWRKWFARKEWVPLLELGLHFTSQPPTFLVSFQEQVKFWNYVTPSITRSNTKNLGTRSHATSLYCKYFQSVYSSLSDQPFSYQSRSISSLSTISSIDLSLEAVYQALLSLYPAKAPALDGFVCETKGTWPSWEHLHTCQLF